MRTLLWVAFFWACSSGMVLAHFHEKQFENDTETEKINSARAAIMLGPVLAVIILSAKVYDKLFVDDVEKGSK